MSDSTDSQHAHGGIAGVEEVQHSKKRQFRPYNLFIVIFMGLGSISYGYSASIIATTLAQPSFISYFDLATRPNALGLISAMNGVYQAGGFLGCLILPFFADRWGRKNAITVTAVVSVISGIILAGSTNIGEFIAIRFFAGAGAFMIVTAVPIWMTEVVPPANRGLLVDINSVGLLFGYFFANWAGYGFFFTNPLSTVQWRVPMGLQSVPGIILLLGMYWLPESPRWLLMHDRFDEAKKVLLKLHTAEEADVEYLQIRVQMQIDKGLDSSYWKMITKPSYRKRTLLALGTTCGIQCSGILVINNYGPTIYATLGYGTEKQLLLEGGWITLAVGAGFLSLLVIDRVSRPKLIAAGIGGCMIMLILEAALVANFSGTNNVPALKAAVAVIYIYVAIYEIGLDGTQFAYVGEIFPSHLRAKGFSVAIAGICAINILWLQVAPTAFFHIGWKFYLCFIILSGVASIGIWCYFPDTKGIPLEEIAHIFGDEDELYQGNLYAEETKVQEEASIQKEEGIHVEHQ